MSAVREQEELRREGSSDFVEVEILGRTPWQLFWVRFRRDRVALGALGFILLLVLVALFAGPITSAVAHPPNAQYPGALDPLFGTPTGPSSKYFFGVDQIGRDVFSRVVYGAPRHPYTGALLSAVPSPTVRAGRERRRVVLEGDVPSPVAPPSACRFHTRCWKAQQICREQEPPLESKGPHDVAACHFPLSEGEVDALSRRR